MGESRATSFTSCFVSQNITHRAFSSAAAAAAAAAVGAAAVGAAAAAAAAARAATADAARAAVGASAGAANVLHGCCCEEVNDACAYIYIACLKQNNV